VNASWIRGLTGKRKRGEKETLGLWGGGERMGAADPLSC